MISYLTQQLHVWADQFDETDEKQKASTWKFFNWYYFCIGVSMLVAVTVIVYIQDYIGWGWGHSC
ncbi:putative proton-dependent oligopeptide transporter family [Helianthus anomalus]